MKFVTTLEATPEELVSLAEQGLNKAAELYVAVLAELNKPKYPDPTIKGGNPAEELSDEGRYPAATTTEPERKTLQFPTMKKSLSELDLNDPIVKDALQKAASAYDSNLRGLFNATNYDPRPRPMQMPNQVPYLKREADPVPAPEPETPAEPDEVDEFIRLKLEVQERLAGLQGNARTMFEKGVMRLFEKHPELHIINWKQYVPAFNDGEPCTFSMYDQAVNGITEGGFGGDEDLADYLDEDDNPGVLEKVEAFQDAVEKLMEGVEYDKRDETLLAAYPFLGEVFKFLSAFTYDDYETMFDSNAEIHITRDKGVITGEYYCGY